MLIFSDLNYRQVLNNRDTLFHDLRHELAHLLSCWFIQWWFGCPPPYHFTIAFAYFLAHVVWQSDSFAKGRIAFAAMVLIHILFYAAFGKSFYFDLVEMIPK